MCVRLITPLAGISIKRLRIIMTVKRQKSVVFNKPIELVMERIRIVLASNKKYTETIEGVDGSFLTLVQPNPLLLDTPMRIMVEWNGDDTVVKVSTKSQPFVWGDIFGVYNRYINEFFKMLEEEIKK